MYDSCWGLAFAALAPLVIGTDLVTAPSAHAVTMVAAAGGGDGEPDGWPDPCLDDPQSDECAFFMEWLDVQEDLWSSLWDVPYVHGKSTISIEQIGTAYPVGVWNVAVWEDAGLDYEDPDLDEEDVLDQMVAEGWFDILYAEPIGWDDDMHVDPDDGTVTTVSATTFIAAGTLTDQTGLVAAHALATITRFEVSNSLGNEQIVVNVGVIETPETVEAALDSAVEIADVVMEASLPPDTPTSPGGGAGTDPGDDTGFDGDGDGPPDRCPECSPCLWATMPGAPPMTDECCDCYKDHADRVGDCRFDFKLDVAECTVGGLGGAVFTKATLCVKLCAAGPYVCAVCLVGTSAAAVGGIVWCLSRARRDYNTCINNSSATLALCLAVHDCN